ncbi:tyrosine-protein phosphatase [Phytomonospora endophytica]|uniref:Protein-tyrosine phosphatase n=1 Tax=Phytomonospora endophytica TaxID=714109 RepID=A0A841FNX7_9ACTN|nr:tyrosine-protein phosphatase [Phytomonospora endophytica]MBB6033650.1 protein-tyrosine phosphatase [Phytomonospora endophytica]GIG64834.1 protein-tyrosine-phosphatase [Phytomonospora endophytica]
MTERPSKDHDNAEAGASPRPPAVEEPRRVVLGAVHNMRDLGGLETADGRVVRSGVLFRSDMLKHATGSDLERIGALGLRTVIDLRRPDEIALHGHFEAEGVDYRHLELRHLRWELFEQEPATHDERVLFLRQRYSGFLESGSDAIRESLDLITNQSPTLVHCIAGKDRTGIVVAVTLGLLGVAEADIAADFALTASGQQRYQAWAEREGLEVFRGLTTPEEAMLGTLQELRSRYGSFEGYARIIGFADVDKLKDALLD